MSTFIFLLVCFFLYFTPTIVAMNNNNKNLAGIMILNIFLGWTLVFWVLALVWAVTSKK